MDLRAFGRPLKASITSLKDDLIGLATNPDSPNSLCRTHMTEGENWHQKFVVWPPPYLCRGTLRTRVCALKASHRSWVLYGTFTWQGLNDKCRRDTREATGKGQERSDVRKGTRGRQNTWLWRRLYIWLNVIKSYLKTQNWEHAENRWHPSFVTQFTVLHGTPTVSWLWSCCVLTEDVTIREASCESKGIFVSIITSTL